VCDLETPDVDEIASNAWLKVGQLFPEKNWMYDSHSGSSYKHKYLQEAYF
jgi:hypothetical protein